MSWFKTWALQLTHFLSSSVVCGVVYWGCCGDAITSSVAVRGGNITFLPSSCCAGLVELSVTYTRFDNLNSNLYIRPCARECYFSSMTSWFRRGVVITTRGARPRVC